MTSSRARSVPIIASTPALRLWFILFLRCDSVARFDGFVLRNLGEFIADEIVGLFVFARITQLLQFLFGSFGKHLFFPPLTARFQIGIHAGAEVQQAFHLPQRFRRDRNFGQRQWCKCKSQQQKNRTDFHSRFSPHTYQAIRTKCRVAASPITATHFLKPAQKAILLARNPASSIGLGRGRFTVPFLCASMSSSPAGPQGLRLTPLRS